MPRRGDVLRQIQAINDGRPLGGDEPRGAEAAPARPRVGSYQRISDAYESAKTGVTTEGVERQAKSCDLTAQAREWDVVKSYVDNHVSAFKDVRREAFEGMLADLEAGVIDGIVVYNLDRFARRPDDLERAIAIYAKARKADRPLYFASAQGGLDLASDDGLTMARIMIAFANKASLDTARRVAAKHQATRDEGRRVAGARAFGWDHVRDEESGETVRILNEDESDAIRWAAEGLTQGALSWRRIVHEWNDEYGLSTPRGGRWQPQTVKQVMRSPRLAGWLVHRDEIAIHSQTGEPIRSDAPPILSDEEFEALLAVIDTTGGYSTASGRRRYLLAGLARCFDCGSRMVGNAQPSGRFVYRCDNTDCETKPSCSGSGLDELVTEWALPRIVSESRALSLTERLLSMPVGKDGAGELEEERRDLRDRVVEGTVPTNVALPRIAEIDRRLEVIRQARRAEGVARAQLHGEMVTPNAWAAMDTDTRRTHISRHLEAVHVRPRLRNTGRKFDPKRATITPKPNATGGES